MLRFFRQIRKKLMQQNKIRTYLLYAIGEILLVVTGILIALQVNNWHEDRLKRSVSDQTVQNLKAELQDAFLSLETAMTNGRRMTADAEKYIYGQLNTDSIRAEPFIVFTWTSYPPVNLSLPILEQETGSDRQIVNAQILNEQLRVIKSRIGVMEDNLFYLDEFWNREVAPYYVESNSALDFDLTTTKRASVSSESAVRVFNDNHYRNLVTLNNLLRRDYLGALQKLKDSINDALELIEPQRQ